LNSGPRVCLEGALPLEPCPHPFFALVISQIRSYFCPGPALDCDYRCAALCLALLACFICTGLLAVTTFLTLN
jgi:hypothetical protein